MAKLRGETVADGCKDNIHGFQPTTMLSQCKFFSAYKTKSTTETSIANKGLPCNCKSFLPQKNF